jgi:hypothetical protein
MSLRSVRFRCDAVNRDELPLPLTAVAIGRLLGLEEPPLCWLVAVEACDAVSSISSEGGPLEDLPWLRPLEERALLREELDDESNSGAFAVGSWAGGFDKSFCERMSEAW